MNILIGALVLGAMTSIAASAQTSPGLLTSREELSAAMARAEASGNPLQASALRQRLTDGDFQVGDRIILSYFSDVAHIDTLVVRAGRVVDLPGKTALPLSGVLRSELKPRLSDELLKFVKAQSIDAIPLTRIAVLGEVTRPGYFALRSDIPITDAIMLAGGPTGTADVQRSVVKRGSREYRSADETRQAVARGLTLDQFGLGAGDELVVGRQRQRFSSTMTAAMGLVGTLAAVMLAVQR